MKITLIVATYNGQDTLPVSLASLDKVLLPANIQLNAIFVDNDSNDNTLHLLQNFSPSFQYNVLKQPKKGKNAALNTIFEHKSLLGEYLIFSDDDVIFEPNFFIEYTRAFDLFHNCSVFGGAVLPHWETPPSKALLNGIDEVVAFAITPLERGYTTGEIAPEKLHGPNMAIKTEVFETGIRFNEHIGPNGGNYMMGSETELLLRLRNEGYRATFISDASVKHIIHSYQLSTKWLRGRAYKAGRSMMMHQLKNQTFKRVPEIFGLPRWAALMILQKYVSTIIQSKRSSQFYKSLWISSHLRGYCKQYTMHLKDRK